MSVNKKNRFRKPQRSNEAMSSPSSSSASSSDSETDARDLKSIKEYLSNRKELASQLFKSVKTEKIRMMLPQALKKLSLNELQELCGNELSGMSKSRIIAIINGQQLLESSNTEESDNSGPSLEIISDTEEWLTDDSSKPKKDSKKAKKAKPRVKSEPKENSSKIKIEGDKNASKDKDGDSLLDLLELEMRARAIRALIRKEEDVTPTTSEGRVLDKKISAVKQRVINELGPKELENIMKQTEDEDVVLVVEPTTTIELLSTDSENDEGNLRVNQRLENERKTGESRKILEISKEIDKSVDNKKDETVTDMNDKSVADEGVGDKNDETLEKSEKSDSSKIKKEGTIVMDLNEEIIDLDDYSDDIIDSEDDESRKKDAENSETWATRYYQTDDVKSVIKESKIQSEIRKRLRERQRMRKVHKSPTDQTQSEATEPNPIGSVQEYLALKATLGLDSGDAEDSKDDSNGEKEGEVEGDLKGEGENDKCQEQGGGGLIKEDSEVL